MISLKLSNLHMADLREWGFPEIQQQYFKRGQKVRGDGWESGGRCVVGVVRRCDSRQCWVGARYILASTIIVLGWCSLRNSVYVK